MVSELRPARFEERVMRDFHTARADAQASAMFNLQGLYSGPPHDVLDAEYRESDHCWMFFQRKDIYFPPGRELRKWAYANSKHSSEGRCVPDFRDDEARLREYLQLLSDHFAKSAPTGAIVVPDPNA